MPHINNAEELTCNAEVLGAILDLSPRRIQQLAAMDGEKPIITISRGVYDLIGSIRAFAQYDATKPKNGNGQSGGDYEANRARLTGAKADMAEMQRDTMAGKLHDADAVRQCWGLMASNCKAKILAAGSSIAPRCEGISAAEIKELIDEAARAALGEIADYSAEAITGVYVATHGVKAEESEEEE